MSNLNKIILIIIVNLSFLYYLFTLSVNENVAKNETAKIVEEKVLQQKVDETNK